MHCIYIALDLITGNYIAANDHDPPVRLLLFAFHGFAHAMSSCQATYGQIFARYIEDPNTLFVISSDFCHWGGRFHFSPYDASSSTPIFEQIANLDKQERSPWCTQTTLTDHSRGMDAISRLQPSHFNEYLKRTQNTICGRNPILVLLQAAEHFRQSNNHTHEFHFLHYSQSNQVRSASDSSVSYAAGALFIHPN